MRISLTTLDLASVFTPGGRLAHFIVREGTSDAPLVGGIVGEDEYALRDLPSLSGWAIDIGAHIGTVAIALALDNPDLRVVAVEALPENVEVLVDNVTGNRLHERVFVQNKAAGRPGETSVPITYGWSRAENQPDGYMADNRYIGGMVGPNETSTTLQCPAVSLDALMAEYQMAEVELLKIDCEGCEWYFLDSPAISKVRLILGELHHGKRGGAREFRALLEPTHEVKMDDSRNVTHFRATRKVP